MHPEPKRISDNSFVLVVRDFMSPANPKWGKYSEATRDLWARELTRAAGPDCLGDLSVNTIAPFYVQAYLDGIADRPAKQEAALAALRAVEKWAIVRRLLPYPITTGCEIQESDGGHIPWTDEQVALAEKFCRPDFARVVTLAANTGQRGSDLVRMGWSDISLFDGQDGINVTQRKTGRKLWIPITKQLATAMATWERQPGPLLRKKDGSFWTRKHLTAAWNYERKNNRDIEELKRAGLVLHGLRAHACVKLLRHGFSPLEIGNFVGMSPGMVSRYTRFSDQQKNVMATLHRLEGRTYDLTKRDRTAG